MADVRVEITARRVGRMKPVGGDWTEVWALFEGDRPLGELAVYRGAEAQVQAEAHAARLNAQERASG